MNKMNEKSLHHLADEELAAVSGARRLLGPFPPSFPFPYPYPGKVDASKHVDQSIVVSGNTFSEKGPGDQVITIGGQSATL